MQLDKLFYEKMIDYIVEKMSDVFKNDISLEKKQINYEHMGSFEITFLYQPLNYKLVFENELTTFSIGIYDENGAFNHLNRICDINNNLNGDDISQAINKLYDVVKENNFIRYFEQNGKMYKIVENQVKRVKDLRELSR